MFDNLGAVAGADSGGMFVVSLAYDPTGLPDLPFTLSLGIKSGALAGDTTVSIDGFAYNDAGDSLALHYDLSLHIPDPNAVPIAGTPWLVLAGLTLLPIARITRKKHAAPTLAG